VTPLESAARELVKLMVDVTLVHESNERLDALMDAYHELCHRLHHIEDQRNRRAKRKVQS
jgi:hypothetical protein